MNLAPKIKKKLDRLKGKIDTKDKIEAAQQLGVHLATIDRYLRGDIRKEAFGLNLLTFLKNRIQEREKVLQS